MRRKIIATSINKFIYYSRRARKAWPTAILACLLLSGSFTGLKSAQAAGASLYFAPSSGTYTINKTFSVSVKVGSGGQAINAAEGTISYDSNLLDVAGISKSGSIFTLWTTEPAASGGSIRFGGGIPHPGYNGAAGQICTVTFKSKRAGDATVRFTGGAVLASDGKGTNILASMGSAKFKIAPATASPEPAKPAPAPAEPAEPEYNLPKIVSPTHPDQNAWYRLATVEFKWEPPSGVTGVSFDFNQNPVTDPGNVSDGLISEKKFEGVKDGVWHFHLKYKDSQRWGTVVHYKIMIDATPPLPFTVEVRQTEAEDWPELHFEAKDETSGIKNYQVVIDNLEGQGQEVAAEKRFLQAANLAVGEHAALVRAVDQAGNETLATANFTIAPIAAPVIRDYPAEIRATDRFYLGGTALPGATINIFIGQDSGARLAATTTSDADGRWLYLHGDSLPNGRYIAWAEAVNDRGLRSGPSNKVTFLVSPPVFTQVGSFVINYFTVFMSLLFLILLIIAVLFYLFSFFRRKLKKETLEIEEVLHKNLTELHNEIDKDLERLDKARSGPTFSSEKAKVRQQLKENISQTEKKILKEIKDVEEILK
ncbi:MAG: cohesin domain-containing protein [Planctomycetes bacterium]|jgi:hypothetical protein|nr:cohesin domain-containing protein [Planctomycetota bacterium]